MSSPTPASATAAALAGILGHNQQQPRRMSNTFNSLPLGPGGGSNRSLTPPTQQPSPNSSFLAGLSSRLRSQGAPGAPGVNSSNINASAPNYGMRNTGPLVDIGMFDAGSTGSQFGYRSVGQNFGIPSGPSGPPTLDMNEFPSLGGPSGSNLSGGSAPGSNRPNFGGIFKDSERTEYKQQPAPIYTMDVNDFPALTATNPPMANSGLENSKHGVSGGGVDHHQTPQNQFTTGGLGLGGEIGVGSSNQLSSSGSLSGGNSNSGTKTLTSSSTGEQKKGIQTHKSGRVTNIPMGMVTDQFGMTGLLTFIRAAETEPKLVSLALGTDLTSLKLDLNSSENLYSNFPGPWSDLGLKPHEIDYPVPSEYLIYHQIRDKLAPIRDKINRYGEDTLFYLYYSFPNDLLQIAAASELYNRDWRYHKDEKIWITRAPGMPPLEKTTTYERGTYYFFDPNNWRRVAKEFHLDYDRLENRPASAVLVNHLQSAAGGSAPSNSGPVTGGSAVTGSGGPASNSGGINTAGQLPQGNLMVS